MTTGMYIAGVFISFIIIWAFVEYYEGNTFEYKITKKIYWMLLLCLLSWYSLIILVVGFILVIAYYAIRIFINYLKSF